MTAQPGTCPVCGAKVRLDRARCPRCRAKLAPPDPAAAAAFSRKLRITAGAVITMFLVTLTTLWIIREPAPALPAGPVADPLETRRAEPEATRPPAGDPANVPLAERPFLDPSGEGYVAYTSGNYLEALEKFMQAVARNPRDAEALSNLGQVLVRLDRAAEALPFFERAIAEIPDRWAYHFNRARAFATLSRWPEAVASYRRAQELFPDDYATGFNLALTLHKSGDDAAAVEQYLKAIAIEPNDPSFRMALGISYEKLEKRAEAAAAYQEALRLAPDAPDAEKVRARIALLTGSAMPATLGTPAAPQAPPRVPPPPGS